MRGERVDGRREVGPRRAAAAARSIDTTSAAVAASVDADSCAASDS